MLPEKRPSARYERACGSRLSAAKRLGNLLRYSATTRTARGEYSQRASLTASAAERACASVALSEPTMRTESPPVLHAAVAPAPAASAAFSAMRQ